MHVCTTAHLHDRGRPHGADHLRQSLQAVADDEEHILDATVTQVREHAHPELRALTTGARPEPQDVPFAVEGDTDRRVERAVGDLPVADLDHDRVDEDRRVDLLERSHGPVVHLLDHLVGGPGDGLLADRRAIDLGEVRALTAERAMQAPPSRRSSRTTETISLNRSRPLLLDRGDAYFVSPVSKRTPGSNASVPGGQPRLSVRPDGVPCSGRARSATACPRLVTPSR
jgi:hypothetical protein